MTATNLTTPPDLRETRSAARHAWAPEAAAMMRLATPIALVSLVNMAMSVTDTIMSAGLGAHALAAVAVGSDFYSILFYFAAGVVSGLGPYYSSALAAADVDRAARMRLTGWIVAAICAVLSVPVIWFAPHYLGFLGLDPGLLIDGTGYTQAMALTLVPMLVVTMYRTRLSAEERPGTLLRVTVAAVPLNAGLNYILMFGIAEWPGLGTLGAGLSSLLVAVFIAVMLMILGRARESQAVFFPRLVEIGEVLRTGAQIGVATVAEVGIFLGATLFAATLGPADVAAHAVAIRAAGLAYALPVGLLQAAAVRTSRAEGMRDAIAQRQTVFSGLALGAATGALLFALISGASFLPANILVGAMGPGAAEIAATLLLVVALIQLYDAPAAVASGILRGRRDTHAPMVFTLVGYWAISAPVGALLATVGAMGSIGIWIGLAAGTAVSSVLLMLRLRRHAIPDARKSS